MQEPTPEAEGNADDGSYYSHCSSHKEHSSSASNSSVGSHDDEALDDLSVHFSSEDDEENENGKQRFTAAAAAAANRRTSQKRNAGRSKISTGTKKYMAAYKEHCSDGILRLGNLVPDFPAETSQGRIESFHKWKQGKWAVLFSHPSDFTPVCTTEIAAIAAKNPELKECDCLLIGLSVDSAESHQAWVQDIVAHYQEQFGRELQESELDFPIIADSDRNVANLFGMIDDSTESNVTIRTVFIIDPDHRLRLNLNYPASVGRNVNEIVRCIKALQLSYQKSVATPENWPHNHPEIKLEDGSLSRQFKGSVFLLPTVTTEQAFLNYPRYHTCEVPSQKKYLRLVQASHVGVDASSASMGSTDEDHNSYNTNGAVMSSKKSNGDGEIPNGNNNKATKREDKGIQTVEEPFQWPWERHDPVYDSKIASAKDQTTTSAQGEPFRWPWESSESTSDESAPKRHIASKGGNKTEDRLVAKKGELLFKWPWEKNSGGWKWPWEEDDQK